ncbi:MAG: hypothetical protein ACYDAD_09095 [Acidimicrobiales bacterium]
MLRRLFWLSLGAALGLGSAFWVMRFVRSTIDRYTPERLSADLDQAVRRMRRDLRSALAEGRDAMREREEELRAELARRAAR